MFEKLRWSKDRAVLDDLVFRLEQEKKDDWDLGNEYFLFYKDKDYVDSYARWLPRVGLDNILELGIFDGGSMVLFNECLAPKKFVGIDVSEQGESANFRKYVQSRGLQDRLKTYWGVDQADSQALRAIVAREFDAPLDLVIDDASHFYGPTKTSFETLFPLVREGGFYIIEDWPLEFCAEPDIREYYGKHKPTMTDLVVELMRSVYSRALVNLVITREFVMAERGPLRADQLDHFTIPVPSGASTPG